MPRNDFFNGIDPELKGTIVTLSNDVRSVDYYKSINEGLFKENSELKRHISPLNQTLDDLDYFPDIFVEEPEVVKKWWQIWK